MSKAKLLADLEAYQPYDATEQDHLHKTLELLRGTDDCFLRSDFPAHIVGGGWLVSKDGSKVLLTRHKTLNRWLQFGGHADGDTQIADVALRETLEESGIKNVEFVTDMIFDVDAHPIPANPKKGEPEHMHYELRYLLRAKDDAIVDPECEVRWFAPEDLAAMEFSDSVRRMIAKWQAWLRR